MDVRLRDLHFTLFRQIFVCMAFPPRIIIHCYHGNKSFATSKKGIFVHPPEYLTACKIWRRFENFHFPICLILTDSFLTLLPDVFKSLIQNLEVKYSVNFSRIMAHKNMRVFSHDKVENKLFKASIFWMNDSRIHRNMKIARDDSTAKLGFSERIS